MGWYGGVYAAKKKVFSITLAIETLLAMPVILAT
jgi:hypothetical protein